MEVDVQRQGRTDARLAPAYVAGVDHGHGREPDAAGALGERRVWCEFALPNMRAMVQFTPSSLPSADRQRLQRIEDSELGGGEATADELGVGGGQLRRVGELLGVRLRVVLRAVAERLGLRQ